jgi:hypothetical protein
MAMTRREFIKSGAAALCAQALNLRGQQTGWSLRNYFVEQIRDYRFPFDQEHFTMPDRIVALRGPFRSYLARKAQSFRPDRTSFLDWGFSSPDRPDRAPFFYALLNIGVKEQEDLRVCIGNSPESVETRGMIFNYTGARGSLNVVFPLEGLGDIFYYRVFRKEGRVFIPTSPLRAVRNPRYRTQADVWLFGDQHCFDDYPTKAKSLGGGRTGVDNHLTGEFHNFYLTQLLLNPKWSAHDSIYAMANTWNLANAQYHIIDNDTLPDAIFYGGDENGLHQYTFGNQGIGAVDPETIARILWSRMRNISVLSPLVPIYFVPGNHDGEGIWHNILHPYAQRARRSCWPQPGFHEGGSPNENFFNVPLANGSIDMIVGDCVTWSGETVKASPSRPEHFTLGDGQMGWLDKTLRKSDASIRMLMTHHLLGGYLSWSEGNRWSGYGRGPLYVEADYEAIRKLPNPPVDVGRVEQPKITEMCRRYGAQAILSFHDHIFFRRLLGRNIQGQDMFGMMCGSPNVLNDEYRWMQDPFWQQGYGRSGDLTFLNQPCLTRFEISSSRILTSVVCASRPGDVSNLNCLRAGPGDVVRRHLWQDGRVVF